MSQASNDSKCNAIPILALLITFLGSCLMFRYAVELPRPHAMMKRCSISSCRIFQHRWCAEHIVLGSQD